MDLDWELALELLPYGRIYMRKLRLELAAKDWSKGDRVAVKLEGFWYAATVTRGTSLLVSVITDKGIKKSYMTPTKEVVNIVLTRSLKRALTLDEVKALGAKYKALDPRTPTPTARRRALPAPVVETMWSVNIIQSKVVLIRADRTQMLYIGSGTPLLPTKLLPEVTRSSKATGELIAQSEIIFLDFAIGWVREGYKYRNNMASKLTPAKVPLKFRKADTPVHYRGILLPHISAKKLLSVGQFKVRPRRLASWTSDFKLATIFGGGFTGRMPVPSQDVGYVYEANISTSDIVINITGTILRYIGKADHDKVCDSIPPEYEVLVEQSGALQTIKLEDIRRMWVFEGSDKPINPPSNVHFTATKGLAKFKRLWD